MLNEIREFEQYTYPLDAEKPSIRLKHGTICNELSGTARAMKIIARKSIFDHDGSGRIDQERINQAKNDLQVWCGDLKGKPEKASDGIVFSWLPDYMVTQLGKEKASKFETHLKEKKGLDAFPSYSDVCSLFEDVKSFEFDTFRDKVRRKELMDKAKRLSLFCKELGKESGKSEEEREESGKDKDQPKAEGTSRLYGAFYNILKALNTLNGRYGGRGFNKKMFDDKLDRTEKNDFKKITYEKIIADAIAEGPLTRYYLICEKDDLSDIEYVTKKTDKETNETKVKRSRPFQEKIKKNRKIEWSNSTKTKADIIMKSVAAVLLEQKSRDAKDLYDGAVPVNKTDIANWLAGYKKTLELDQFEINGRRLFKSEKIDNVAAVSIDTDWMKSCGWRVIPENELDQYLSKNPETVFFSDPGAGAFLQKNVKYE